MPNWFNKIAQPVPPLPPVDVNEEDNYVPPKEIRYRATPPIDVWIEDTGNEEQNINEAYSMITEGLQRGDLPNYQLSPSDIARYDKLFQ